MLLFENPAGGRQVRELGGRVIDGVGADGPGGEAVTGLALVTISVEPNALASIAARSSARPEASLSS